MHSLTHTYIGTFWNALAVAVLNSLRHKKTVLFMVCIVGVLCMPHFSSAQVTLSGTVYSDAGVTAQAVSKTIKVAVGTSTPGFYSTTTTVTTGAWTVTIPVGHGIATGTPIMVWIDNDAATRGTVVTKANSSATAFSITGLDLYKDRVIVRHEASSATSTTWSDFAFYTSTQDSDLQHSTSTGLLTIAAGNELYVWPSKTFAPGSAVTIAGNASSTSLVDGSFRLTASAIYTAFGDTTIAGSLRASSSATFTPGSSFLVFNATTTGRIIDTTLATLGNVRFSGSGGAWSFTQSVATTSELTIVTGTLTAPSSTLIVTGAFQNFATFTHNSGTLQMNGPVSTSTADIAAFAVGRDSSGNNASTSAIAINYTVANNNILYVAKAGGATACSQATAFAAGCELMVFDISSSTNPIYVAGRDADGSATGVQNLAMNSITVSGNYLYITKASSATACSQVAGSAVGCELMVFDISSSTNPIYVAGRDADGNAAGTTAVNATNVVISGTTLYLAKAAAGAVACTTQANCELMVFSISSSTNPTYVTGRDASGSAAGTQTLAINTIVVSGTMLYAVKAGNATACSQTAGSAVGCELMVFDISSTTNPTYVAGRDVNGDTTGTGNLNVSGVAIASNGLYISKAGSATQCTQTTGVGASGCELMVFDISSTTNPLYVAGRDVGGSATGIQNLAINYLLTLNNYLYVAKAANATPCLQSEGLALGCELMIFDVASTSAPVLISARDVGGDTLGIQSLGINALGFSSSSLYIAKVGSATACSQVTGAGTIGCELMAFTNTTRAAGLLTGVLFGSSALNHVTASGTIQFIATASTSNLTIGSTATITAPTVLTIAGNYSNQGNFNANEGTILFSSNSAQNLSGTLSGSSSLSKVVFTGSGTKTLSSNASTSQLTIAAGATVSAPTQLAFSDTFTNNGTFTANSGTVFGNSSLGEFLAGVSAGGATSTDLQTLAINTYAATGTILYAGKAGSATACSQVVGSAVGCELMVFDISSTTNPVYVAGRDSSGSNASTSAIAINDLKISGNYLYVGKAGSAIACSQANGFGAGCELMVFDISSTTNPIYVAGRDAYGDAVGTSTLPVVGTVVSNSFLYIVKGTGSVTACSQTAGSAAVGCELMVFDISSTTNPIYVAGRDGGSGQPAGNTNTGLASVLVRGSLLYVGTEGAGGTCSAAFLACELMVYDISSSSNPIIVGGVDGDGSPTGSANVNFKSITESGDYLFVGKAGNATACSQTAGSAIGCELMVFDISSTTKPIYVLGRDTSGSAAGTGNLTVNSLVASGSLLYVGKAGDATTCSQISGNAIGCELMVFDISSTTNPVYVTGRDSNGLRDGKESTAIQNVFAHSSRVVTGKAANANPCERDLGLVTGCESMMYQMSTLLAGTFTGTSALSGLTTNGVTRFIPTNASTSNLTIATSSVFVAPGNDFSLSGNFTNFGTYSANNGEMILTGTNQTLSSVATTTFYDLTQQTSVAATTTFSTTTPFVISRNLTLQGTTSALLKLRSVTGGMLWRISPQSSTTVIAQYVDVKDSNNNSSVTVPLVCTVGCVNSGNNTNWSFVSNIPAWNSTNWTLYDTITVRKTKIESDLTNFPVYVDLNNLSANFWSTVSANGGDIRVTTDGGAPVEIPRELVSFSTTTQSGELYFKAPTLSSATNTIFRIYYNSTTSGDYNVSDTYGGDNVWTNDYVAVYHMGENPGGGAGAIKDSTTFKHNGTGSSTMTLADSIAGRVGQAIDFDGASTDFISTATTSALANLKTLSTCTWYKHDTYTGAYGNLLDKSTDGLNSWNLYLSNANTIGLLNDSSAYKEAAYSPTTGWEYLCATTINSSATTSINLYKNAVNIGNVSAGLAGAPTDDINVPLRLGAGNNGVYPIDGQMDEIRVSSTTRPAAWLNAEYYNQSTTTDFYIVNAGLIVGSSTLAAHTAGQVPNAFSSSNKTNESLFAFKLTPNSGIATVTALVINLSGVTNVVDTDFSNVRLFRDLNNNALYDGSDTAVGGSGVLSIVNGGGSITFSTGFVSSSTQNNYLVVADWNAPINGSYMTVSLIRENITMVGENPTHFVLGSVASVQHQRNNRSGGGGSANVGGDAPAGAGTVGGGGTTGGELIGNDPDYFLPGGNSGSWSGGANAYDGIDGTYASTSAANNHSYTNHGFGLPSGNVVSGIIVKLELSGSTAAGSVDIQLSWDGGVSWTAAKTTPTLTTSDAVRTLGSPSDLWGRTWLPGEFSNANFAVRISGNPSSNSIRLDALVVRVYHVTSGGGSGGGGGI